jgi:sensor domain CHASE-containing protein
MITRTLVLGRFAHLEEQNIRTNVHRFVNALTEEPADIKSTGGNWGSWDETRDFVLNYNKEYL